MQQLNLVDIHAHLDHYKFRNDLDQVIKNARNAGVKAIITCGIDPQTNELALKIAQKYPDIVKVSYGMYPIDALEAEAARELLKFKPFDVDQELEWLKKHKDKFIAVGEVGLDMHSGKDLERQKKDFQKIIEMCETIDKPIIVHTRKAEEEAVKMLENSNLKKVILHCFGGKTELVEKAEENKGWYFSIPPIVVRSKSFQKIVKKVNLSQLLTETDCPYLGPNPELRNEPAFVVETIKKIAKLKRMEEIEVANIIYKNYQDVFLV